MSPIRRSDSESTTSDPGREVPIPPRRRSARALLLALAIGVALGGAAIGPVTAGIAEPTAATGGPAGDVSSVTNDSTLVVSDETADPRATATHRISLTEVPDGLAGFKLTLALEGDDVATVANASYPDRFGLTTDPVVSADDRTVTVEAVDLADEITPGGTDVTLARIDVDGVDHGEAELRVTDAQVDADGGDRVDPSLEAGTLTVGDGPSESASGNESEGAESDDEDTVPGFAAGTALAAIAVIAGVLVTRRS